MSGTVELRQDAEQVTVDRTAAALLGAGLGGSALLLLRPPGAGGSYPPCPFLAATGLDCPFCGGLRGTYALLHGDMTTALDHNILVPFLAAAFLVGGVWWGVRRARGPVVVTWSAPVQRMVLWLTIAGLGVFWVLRNLAFLPYLDSGAG